MPQKNIGYFSYQWERGEDWYLEHFRGATPAHRLIGEATTSYRYTDVSAARIAEFNPDARLVFILRHPVERAFSNYVHEIQMRGDTDSFEEHLDRNDRYVNPGFYARHLGRFRDAFPSDQMHIVLFDRFTEAPAQELVEVARFLDIDPIGFDLSAMNRNERRLPRTTALQRVLYRCQEQERSRLLRGAARRLGRMNQSRPADGIRLQPEIRARLAARFANDIDELERMTGFDLAEWRS